MDTEEKKKNDTSFIAIGIAFVLLVIGVVFGVVSSNENFTPITDDASSIDSFKKCADAGYPIQESFPEVCSVPGGGSFTNN
jgi:hypothetical protein